MTCIEVQSGDTRSDRHPKARAAGLDSVTVFHGSLLTDGGAFEVRVTSDPEGLCLSSPGRPDRLLRHGAGGVSPTEASSQDPLAMLERVLELACRGTFCLHAGAVRVDEYRVAVFLGESGSGKSTLARLIQERSRGAWPRVADDVLPAWPEGDAIRLDAGFPQARLKPAERYVGADDETLVLGALYVLRRTTDAKAPVAARPLRPFESLAAVAGNTMSARLFDPRLLDNHLGFCREVAARVPVVELAYPHRHEAAAEVMARIGEDLAAAIPIDGAPDDA